MLRFNRCAAASAISRFSAAASLAAIAGILACATAVVAAEPASPKAPVAPNGSIQEKETQAEIDKLKNRLDLLRQGQHTVRGEITDACGLSPENVLTTLLALEKERFNLAIDVETKRYERDNFSNLSQASTVEIAKRLETDPVLENLKKIADLRRQTVKDYDTALKSAAVSHADARQAEADLAEAEIRVALRKEELTKAASATSADAAHRAAELTFELQSGEARLATLDRKFAGLTKARDVLDEYNSLGDEIASTKQRIALFDESAGVYIGPPGGLPGHGGGGQ